MLFDVSETISNRRVRNALGPTGEKWIFTTRPSEKNKFSRSRRVHRDRGMQTIESGTRKSIKKRQLFKFIGRRVCVVLPRRTARFATFTFCDSANRSMTFSNRRLRFVRSVQMLGFFKRGFRAEKSRRVQVARDQRKLRMSKYKLS